jgi:beta-lactamase class A
MAATARISLAKLFMKRLILILLACLAVLTLQVQFGHAASPTLPLSPASLAWQPLSQRQDRGLQASLATTLNRHPAWPALISAGKMAVGVVDLSDPGAPRFAQVNGNTMMYGASLPKIVILLAAFQGFEDGSLKETAEIHRDLIEMIRRSDNAAANRVIGRIGLKRLERVILSPRYRFYDAKHGGGLWVGSVYGQYGLQEPEPLKNLLHAATVNQLCRFYYLLAYGKLVNPERSRQMLKIMAFPDLHDKFVKVLETRVPPNRLYRKSGEWRVWYSDSILVWPDAKPRYILVAMLESPKGEQILGELVPVVTRLLKPSSSRPVRYERRKTANPKAGR